MVEELKGSSVQRSGSLSTNPEVVPCFNNQNDHSIAYELN